MSTKTSFKRIALVAASALAIAGFSAVPANATNVAFTAPTVADSTVVLGASVSVDVTFGALTTADIDAACAITFTPTGSSSLGIATSTQANAAINTGANGWAVSHVGTGALKMTAAGDFSDATQLLTDGQVVGEFNFTPTAQGEYTVTVTTTSTGAGCTTPPAAMTFVLAVTSTNPTAICFSKLTEDDTVALATGKYTSDTTLNANCVSSITAVAGSAMEFGVIPITKGIDTSDTGTLYASVRGLQVVHASADPGAVAAGATFLLDSWTAPASAGTYTVDVWYDHDADGNITEVGSLTSSVTLTLTAASDLDLGRSTAFMAGTAAGDGVAASSTSNAVPRSGSKATGTYISQVKVTLLKADGNADTRAHTVTAVVSGSGYVAANVTPDVDPDSTARVATNSAAASVRYVHIEADGTAGSGSVAISVTHVATGVTTAIGTFSYTTYGDVTKFAVSTSNFKVGVAGGDTTGYGGTTRTAVGNTKGALDAATTVPAFIVAATDANGRAANLAPSIVSGDTAVVTSGACDLDDGGVADESSSTNGVGYYNCSFTTSAAAKSGDKTTLTIRAVDPADATKYISTTYDVTVGSTTVATETLAFDKATYVPGEAMVITRSAKDASGNPVADGTDSPALSFSKAIGGTAPGASFYKAGTSATATSAETSGAFAPVIGGDFAVRATSGTGATITATATVEGDQASSLALDAANAATDAANNAYDEAQNATQAASDALAAVTALAAQVKSLIASVKKAAAAVATYKKRTGQ